MLYTPTTTDVEKMNRTDLVFELSKHVHPSMYHNAIKMHTEILRKLLTFYQSPEKSDLIKLSFESPMLEKISVNITKTFNLNSLTPDNIESAKVDLYLKK